MTFLNFGTRIVLTVLTAAFFVPSAQADAGVIPGTWPTLAGPEAAIPAAQGWTVVAVGFSQTGGSRVDAWAKRLEQDFAPDRLTVDTAAVLAGVPSLIRGMVVGLIKAGVPERQRDHFFLVWRREADWRSLMNVTDPNVPYLVLADAAGQVKVRTSGLFTEDRYRSFRDSVRSVLDSSSSDTRLPGGPRGLD